MGTPTKEQWAEIAERLDRLFGDVYLRCDGYLVHAGLVRVSKNQLAIGIWVNGRVDGMWLGTTDAEEAKRFFFPRTRRRFPAKFVRSMERAIGKRRCKAEGYYERKTFYVPFWSRPLPLIRHLRKYTRDIEILDAHAYTEALNAYRAQQEASHAA